MIGTSVMKELIGHCWTGCGLGNRYSNVLNVLYHCVKIPQFHLISWCENFVKRQIFLIVLADSPETMRKMYLSTKFPQQEIRWNYGVLHSVSTAQRFTYSLLAVVVLNGLCPNIQVEERARPQCFLFPSSDSQKVKFWQECIREPQRKTKLNCQNIMTKVVK